MVRLHGRTPTKRDHEAEKPLLPLAIGELKDEPTGRVTLQPDHDFARSDTREKARKIPGIKVLDTGKDNSCRLKATILFLVALAFAATATCLVVWRVYYNGDQCPPGQLRKGNRCFFSIHRTPGAYYPRPSPEHSSAAKNNVNAEKGSPSHRHIRPEGRHPDEVRNSLEAVATLRPPSPDHHKIPVLKTEHWYPKPFYHVETGFFPPEWLKPRPTKHAPTTSTHDNPPKVIQKPTEVPRTRRPFSGIWKALGLTTEQTVVPTPTQPATSTKQQQTTTVKVTTEKPQTTRPPTSAPSTGPVAVALQKTTPISSTKMVQMTTTPASPPTTKAPIVTTTAPQPFTPTTKAEKTRQAVSTYQPPKTTKPVIVTTSKPATTTTMLARGTTANKVSESEATTPKLVPDEVITASQISLGTPTTALPAAMSTITSQVPVSSTNAATPGSHDAKSGVIATTVSQMKLKTTVETSTITPKSEVITKHTIRPSIRGTTAPVTHLPTVSTGITTTENRMQGDQPVPPNTPVKVTPAATQKQTVTPTTVNVLPSPTTKIPTESAVPPTAAEKKPTTAVPTKHTVPDQKTYRTVPMVKIVQEAADVISAPDMKTSTLTRQVPAVGSNKTEASKHAPVIQPEVAKPTSVITTSAPQPPHLSTRPSIEFVATPTAYRTPWHAAVTSSSDDTSVANENVSSITAVHDDATALETAIVTSSTPIEFFTATESMTPKVSPSETKQSTLASVIKSTADREK